MPLTEQAHGETAFILEPQRNLALFKKEGVSHLIFRYAAAPNTNTTTAMTVTVMAAILPVRKRPRKDNERVSLVIFRVPNI